MPQVNLYQESARGSYGSLRKKKAYCSPIKQKVNIAMRWVLL